MRPPALVTLGLLAAILAGCGPEQAASDTAHSDQPVTGGTLRVALDGDPQCLDPHQAGNNTALNVGRQLVDSLTDQHPQSGEIVPWLAERWEVSPDSRRFTFHLRQGATFSDGTPVDAAAVKANLEDVVKLGARSRLGSSYLAGVQRIDIADAHSVAIVFAQPNAQFLQATSTMTLGLLAPSTLARPASERCQGQLIGSGPFVLKQFVHNQAVSLQARTDYQWPSALAEHAGRAWLEAIEFSIIVESGVRLGSLASGQIDVNTSVAPQDEPSIEAQGLHILSRANPGVVFVLALNERAPLLADRRVRQAISRAIDREQFKPLMSSRQKTATALLASSTPFYRDFSPLLKADPQAARDLLEQAGWRLAADGVRQKDGQRLSLTLDYWQAVPILELVQQQLRQVGIELQLNKSTISQVSATFGNGVTPINFLNLTRADPDVLRTVFHTASSNLSNRRPDDIDTALADSAATLQPGLRQTLIDQASQRLLEEGDAIALLELTTVIAHRDQVRGLHYEASSRLQFYDTWLRP